MRTPSLTGGPRAFAARAGLSISIAFLLSSSITGCSSKGGVGPVASTPVGIGTANEQVLTNGAAWYSARRASHDPVEARHALVDTLNHGWPGVARAELGADSTTVALRFSDGHMGAINTNPVMSAGATYDPTAMRTAFLGSLPAGIVLGARGRSAPSSAGIPTAAAMHTRPGRGAARATIYRMAPRSRKVLLLDAAACDFKYDVDSDLFDYMKDYFVQSRGWAASDIVVKANRPADGYGTLDFEDFFRLKDYGLVVIVARSLYWEVPTDPADWNSPRVRHYFVQVSDAAGYNNRHSSGGAERIDVQAEILKGRIMMACDSPVVGGAPTCLYMRDDLWQEQMNGDLPGSVVLLLSPHGYQTRDLFGARQASSFSSWTDSVSTQVALDAAWMPMFMAQSDDADAEAALNGVLPRSYGGSDFVVWPGMPTMVYLPTWADVSTANAPAGSQTVRVTVSYTSNEVMLPDSPTIEDLPAAAKNFIGMVPDQPVRFLAQAMSSTGTVLGEAHVDSVLRTGDDNVVLTFQTAPSGLTLETSTLKVNSLNPANVTLTAAVRDDQGSPIQGRQVQFSHLPAAGTIVGANPATTNASGIASVVVHTEFLVPDRVTVNMIARDLTSSKADTVAVEYCKTSRYAVWLSGTADQGSFSQSPAGNFAVSGVDLRITINGDGPYGVATMSGPTHAPFSLSANYNSGDQLTFVVRPTAAGMPASIGPLYVHVFNCFTHQVSGGGVISAPPNGQGTLTVNVP